MIGTLLDAERKRHTCPVCEGTGKLNDEERRQLLYVLNTAEWAVDVKQHFDAAMGIRIITKLFLLAVGTVIGAVAMWLLRIGG